MKICSLGRAVESTSNSEQDGDTPKLRDRGHLGYGNGLHGLNWSHGVLLIVLSVGVVSAVVYKTTTVWRPSGTRYANVNGAVLCLSDGIVQSAMPFRVIEQTCAQGCRSCCNTNVELSALC